ncbi:hypothetical protein L7F22_061869 [Adiantum nelumboides]|nr:hypothetical protein [Adiantum nelumboides]
MKLGHFIKECPELKKEEPVPTATKPEKKDDFQPVGRKSVSGSFKNNKASSSRNRNNFSPLLEEVFDPLEYIEDQGDVQPQMVKENASHSDIQMECTSNKKIPNPVSENIAGGAPLNPADMEKGAASTSSFDGEDDSIPNTQDDGQPKQQVATSQQQQANSRGVLFAGLVINFSKNPLQQQQVAFPGSIDPCFNMLHADVKHWRWTVPRVALPTQTKCCVTKEDIHTKYGLCLVGQDLKLLCDDDFSDEEWLRVWLYKRRQKEKMHLKGPSPEMYEECLLLYHKVYQGALPNNEVGVHFAHGFTWQKCKGVEDSKGLVAWAVYVEGVIKMLRQQKTLNRKLEKWRSTNGPCLGSEWKFNAKIMPNYTDSTGTGFDWQTYSGGHQILGQAKEEFLNKRAFGLMGTFGMSNVSSTIFSASTANVAAIFNMKANVAEKLKEKQQCLKAIKISFSNQKGDSQRHGT